MTNTNEAKPTPEPLGHWSQADRRRHPGERVDCPDMACGYGAVSETVATTFDPREAESDG